jgi:hypothetical protein
VASIFSGGLHASLETFSVKVGPAPGLVGAPTSQNKPPAKSRGEILSLLLTTPNVVTQLRTEFSKINSRHFPIPEQDRTSPSIDETRKGSAADPWSLSLLSKNEKESGSKPHAQSILRLSREYVYKARYCGKIIGRASLLFSFCASHVFS